MCELNIARVVAPLTRIPGIVAIVLGGSRARGTHRSTSDYDIGLYYEAATFDIAALNRAAQMLDDSHRENLCTAIGGWGPWVTGGGWLVIDGQHVDFIYRDIARVARVIDECRAGVFTLNDQAGHPVGFPSSIYMGEVAVCQALWDPAGKLEELKAKTMPYPAALKQAIFRQMAWQVEFCLLLARGVLQRNDAYYIHALFVRGVTCLVHTLFALNEQWLLNEKGSVAMAARFERAPERLTDRINALLSLVTVDASGACDQLAALDDEVRALWKHYAAS